MESRAPHAAIPFGTGGSAIRLSMLDKQGADAKGGAKNYIANEKMTGGFAVVAYPAKYGDSGIMTFIINQTGVAYQKDLGTTTDQVAGAMTEFDPDKTWKPVEQ